MGKKAAPLEGGGGHDEGQRGSTEGEVAALFPTRKRPHPDGRGFRSAASRLWRLCSRLRPLRCPPSPSPFPSVASPPARGLLFFLPRHVVAGAEALDPFIPATAAVQPHLHTRFCHSPHRVCLCRSAPAARIQSQSPRPTIEAGRRCLCSYSSLCVHSYKDIARTGSPTATARDQRQDRRVLYPAADAGGTAAATAAPPSAAARTKPPRGAPCGPCAPAARSSERHCRGRRGRALHLLAPASVRSVLSCGNRAVHPLRGTVQSCLRICLEKNMGMHA